MASLSHDGIGIILTDNIKQTAYAINKIINKHEEGEERTVEELKLTNADTEDVTTAMLTCIKGISKEKADKMQEQYYFRDGLAGFGSEIRSEPGKIKNDLQMIDGIGETLSQRVIDSLKEA